jgi:hypothetical protein
MRVTMTHIVMHNACAVDSMKRSCGCICLYRYVRQYEMSVRRIKIYQCPNRVWIDCIFLQVRRGFQSTDPFLHMADNFFSARNAELLKVTRVPPGFRSTIPTI